MKNRNRAWRRRKARLILGKIQTTKNWVVLQFKDPKAKAVPVSKQLKNGKLRRAQDLRRALQLNDELLIDGMNT
ncbi:MAG: hypothetical protein P4L46_09520 [Fimbriimonas sp.]|nr:hypothetical protein [Fimbriimonas sp.]